MLGDLEVESAGLGYLSRILIGIFLKNMICQDDAPPPPPRRLESSAPPMMAGGGQVRRCVSRTVSFS